MARASYSPLIISQMLIIWTLPIAISVPSYNCHEIFHIPDSSFLTSFGSTGENQLVHHLAGFTPGIGLVEHRSNGFMEPGGLAEAAGLPSFPSLESQDMGAGLGHNFEGASSYNRAREGDEWGSGESPLYVQMHPLYRWSNQGDPVGELLSTSTIAYTTLLQPKDSQEFPVLRHVEFIKNEVILHYTKEFNKRQTESNHPFARRRNLKWQAFGGVHIFWSEVSVGVDKKVYLIRLGENIISHKKDLIIVRRSQDVEEFFTTMVKRVLFAHSLVLRHNRIDIALAPQKQEDLINWLCDEWFFPKGGLPVWGAVKNLPVGRDKNVFGPIQQLIIEFFAKPYEKRNYGWFASIIVAAWYRTSSPNLWHFERDEDFWNLMSEGLVNHNKRLLPYIEPEHIRSSRPNQLQKESVVLEKSIRDYRKEALFEQNKVIMSHSRHGDTPEWDFLDKSDTISTQEPHGNRPSWTIKKRRSGNR